MTNIWKLILNLMSYFKKSDSIYSYVITLIYLYTLIVQHYAWKWVQENDSFGKDQ